MYALVILSICLNLVGAIISAFQQVNITGSPHVIDAHNMQKWQRAESDAMGCFEFSEACFMIVRELAAIRNKPMRVAAVKKYMASKPNFVFGTDLQERANELGRLDFDVTAAP